MNKLPLTELRKTFGERMHENVPLAKYTSARIGGPAAALLKVGNADELAETVTRLWMLDIPFYMLGGGSNILISDAGINGVVVHNRARKVIFSPADSPPSVWAESGAALSVVARQAAQKGLAGLEWAAGIPGSIGGAVFGNAGAHGGDMASNVKLAEVLHRKQGRQRWTLEQLAFTYRSSMLKSQAGQAVVLAATLKLQHGEPAEIEAKMAEFQAFRRRTQPPGASMGSMFKNPPNDHAGRLIDAVGLKGARIGGAQISPLHANFFSNEENASAQDVYDLIDLARTKVKEQFDIDLELEIQLVGDWSEGN